MSYIVLSRVGFRETYGGQYMGVQLTNLVMTPWYESYVVVTSQRGQLVITCDIFAVLS